MLFSCRVFPYCLIFQYPACGSGYYLIKSFFSPVFFTVDKESKAPERKDASRSLLNHPAFWVLLVVAVISLILNAFLLKILWENGILTLLWRGKDTPLPKLENRTGGGTALKGL